MYATGRRCFPLSTVSGSVVKEPLAAFTHSRNGHDDASSAVTGVTAVLSLPMQMLTFRWDVPAWPVCSLHIGCRVACGRRTLCKTTFHAYHAVTVITITSDCYNNQGTHVDNRKIHGSFYNLAAPGKGFHDIKPCASWQKANIDTCAL